MAVLAPRARRKEVFEETTSSRKTPPGREGRTQVRSRQKVSIQGRSAATLELLVPRDALVRECVLRLGAVRAEATLMADVGDVRLDGAAGTSGATFVVDFGMLRTVSGVAGPPGSTVRSVAPWIGLGFDKAIALPRTDSRIARFPELLTERLQITLGKAVELDEMKSGAGLFLPGPPADLVLSMGEGPPLATFPGRIEPGDSDELTADEWSSAGERLVDVTAALARRVGDPLGQGELKIDVTLAATSPGNLSLEVERLSESRLTRVGLAGKPDHLLDLDSERHLRVALDFAQSADVEGVRFKVSGELPEPRVVDPQGPPASADAELVANAHRSYAFRLPELAGLGAVEGVRLPVRAEGAGAEARVTLWRAAAPGGEPMEALAEGASEPLPIPAGGDPDAWLTFQLKTPVEVDELVAPWAALDVVRGRVVVSLAAGSASGRVATGVRQGTPEGEWRRLPAVFEPGAGLAHLEPRVRVVGGESESEPRLPLRIALAGGAGGLDLDPAGKSVAGEFELAAPLAVDASRPPRLELTAYSAGSARIEEVDLIWSEPLPTDGAGVFEQRRSTSP